LDVQTIDSLPLNHEVTNVRRENLGIKAWAPPY